MIFHLDDEACPLQRTVRDLADGVIASVPEEHAIAAERVPGVDSRDTRAVVAALTGCANAPREDVGYGVFQM
jgi:hypothetical protein